MKAVGIRELKAHLSAYLRDVQRGETVLVTDRGRVVAELRQPGGEEIAESELDRRLRRLAASAPLVVRERHDALVYQASPLRTPKGTAQKLIDEERGER